MLINIFENYSDDSHSITFDYKKIVDEVIALQSKKDEINGNLSLILVDEEDIIALNKLYRHKDYSTDVISFEYDSDEFEEDKNYVGDIFLCIDKVYEQAKLYNHSVEREFAFLLVHGILHLHGYDHLDEEDEKIMFKKQDEILNELNYKR